MTLHVRHGRSSSARTTTKPATAEISSKEIEQAEKEVTAFCQSSMDA
jgi:hypothetical protein